MVAKTVSNFQIKHHKCRCSELQEESNHSAVSHIENTI